MGRYGFLIFSLIILITGCGGSGGGNGFGFGQGQGGVKVSVNALNQLHSQDKHQKRSVKRVSDVAERTLDPSSYAAGSIASGPPDAMKIYIKSIDLNGNSSSPTGSVNLYTSSDPNGTEVDLVSGSVDLGSLGFALNPVLAGNYTGLNVTVARVAQIKGCVTSKWAAHSSATSIYPFTIEEDGSPDIHNGKTYTSDDITADSHQFCTIASRSQVNVMADSTEHVGYNSDYEAQARAEFVDIDLGPPGDGQPVSTVDEVMTGSLNLGNQVTFTVPDGGSTSLTLVVDLDRMLRYFANTRDDFNPPNPNMLTGTSYFFSTVFQNSISIFAGVPGSIEGYQIDVEACGYFGCTPDTIIKTWMTLIKDSLGNVISGMIIPDDDNTLTVVKGWIDPASVQASNVPGAVDMSFQLGEPPVSGELIGFKYKNLGDPEDSCTARALPMPGGAPILNLFYTREL